MKTVGTKQELPTQVLTGSKSHRHSAFQLRSTTTNCTTPGVLKAGEAQIGRDEAASCATKDSGSLFAPCHQLWLRGVDDGQDGARGSKQVSCRQLHLFQSQSLDSKYFQSIGREVTQQVALHVEESRMPGQSHSQQARNEQSSPSSGL